MTGSSAQAVRVLRGIQALLLDLTLVVLAQLFVCALVRTSGFSAISDDDYSRVVIAQGFEARASWDPSGTSWLPLPFFLTGGLMKLLAPTLAVARGAAIILACLSSITLYFAATVLEMPRPWRLASTLVAMSLPYSAYLAVATVPEYSTAAALVFSAASLSPLASKGHPSRFSIVRLSGALTMSLACASRYEAWPAAMAFAAWNAFEFLNSNRATRSRSFTLLASLSLSILFPLVWLLHGELHHQNALFFVKRVVEYKLALGDTLPSLGALLRDYPLKLVSKEPELMLAFGATLVAFFSKAKKKNDIFKELLRPWSPLLTLLLFLVLGATKGGAPTHHSERALLSLWLFAPISVAFVFSRLPKTQRIGFAKFALVGAAMGLSLRLANVSPRQAFIDRSSEEALGARLLHETSLTEEIAVLPRDYGYFALVAAAGTPARFLIFDKHDPRAQNELNAPAERLTRWLKEGGCLHVVPSTFSLEGSRELQKQKSLSLRVGPHCPYPQP